MRLWNIGLAVLTGVLAVIVLGGLGNAAIDTLRAAFYVAGTLLVISLTWTLMLRRKVRKKRELKW